MIFPVLFNYEQLLGAVIGASLLKDSTPRLWIGALGSHDISNGVYPSQAFLMEIMLTFVLIFVIFGVAVDRRGPGENIYSLTVIECNLNIL